MAKIAVCLEQTLPVQQEQIPKDDPSNGRKYLDLRSLNREQKAYFMEAYRDFRANVGFWDFDRKWLSPTPLVSRFSQTISMALGRDKNEPQLPLSLKELKKAHGHPLYLAIAELWTVLGLNQGRKLAFGGEKTVFIWI